MHKLSTNTFSKKHKKKPFWAMVTARRVDFNLRFDYCSAIIRETGSESTPEMAGIKVDNAGDIKAMELVAYPWGDHMGGVG